jgi:predicted transcriptional regulator
MNKLILNSFSSKLFENEKHENVLSHSINFSQIDIQVFIKLLNGSIRLEDLNASQINSWI